MATLVIRPLDQILAQHGKALAELGGGKARMAMARAMNHEMPKAMTQVKRALAQQTSIPARIVKKATKLIKASSKGDALEAMIIGTGKPIGLKYFQPRQLKAGAKAKVWGSYRLYPSSFDAPGSPGRLRAKLHGVIYKRAGSARYPLVKLHGPGIAIEIIIGASEAAFIMAVSAIPDRVGHEIARILGGK